MNQATTTPNNQLSVKEVEALLFLKSFSDISRLRKAYIKVLLEEGMRGELHVVNDKEELDDLHLLWTFLEKMDNKKAPV